MLSNQKGMQIVLTMVMKGSHGEGYADSANNGDEGKPWENWVSHPAIS